MFSNPQSTHSQAVQTSAGNLFSSLFNDFERSDYTPNFEGLCIQLSTIFKPNSNVTKENEQAQATFKKLYENQDAWGILDFINYVSHNIETLLPNENENERELKKAVVFEFMLKLMKFGTDEFTKNYVLDQQEAAQKNTVVNVSLGATLNLVCLALMGTRSPADQAYAAVNDNDDNKKARILSLFNTLYRLSSSKNCSAEKQHDMLFLLNGVYPIKCEDGSYKRLDLIQDWDAFLIGNISRILSKFLTQDYPDENLRLTMTLDWIKLSLSNNTSKFNSIASWLKSKTDVVSCELKKIMQQHEHVIPNEKIQGYLEQICLIHPTDDIHPVVPGLIEVMSLSNVKSTDIPFATIRNEALDVLKQIIANAQSFSDLRVLVTNFLKAERSLQRIIKYDAFDSFIGQDNQAFARAKNTLKESVQACFQAIKAGQNQDETKIDEARSSFNEVEKEFEKKVPVDRLVNYFASAKHLPLRESDPIDKEWEYLTKNFGDKLLLNDTEIDNIFSNKNDDGTISITTQEINRILIHAMYVIESDTLMWGGEIL